MTRLLLPGFLQRIKPGELGCLTRIEVPPERLQVGARHGGGRACGWLTVPLPARFVPPPRRLVQLNRPPAP